MHRIKVHAAGSMMEVYFEKHGEGSNMDDARDV